MNATASACSGKPLAQKLGLKAGCRVVPIAAPSDYPALLGDPPADLSFGAQADRNSDVVHLFVSRAEELATRLAELRAAMRPDAVLWVSWPKKAARIKTDVSEDVIREKALPLGWVDVKVCAVDATWSGLKLVVRKAMR